MTDRTIKILANPHSRQHLPHSINDGFEIIDEIDLDKGLVQLKNSSIDVLIFPLDQIPLSLEEGMVITALTERESSKYCLVIHEAYHNPKATLGLSQHANLICFDKYTNALAKSVFPENTNEISNKHYGMAKLMQESEFQAAIIPSYVKHSFDSNIGHLLIKDLNTVEFVPKAGMGSHAILVQKSEINLRKKLNNLFPGVVYELTNIERMFYKQAQNHICEDLGIQISRDRASNVHLYLCLMYDDGELNYYRHSSSSTVGVQNFLTNLLK